MKFKCTCSATPVRMWRSGQAWTIQVEAYKMIIPGQTTDADVAKFLKAKMTEYGGKDAWHPDRGHSQQTK